MACPHFLNFQPTERPSWRMIRDQNDTIPKISEMITQILQYENTWRRKENTNQYSAVKKHMYLEFLYQIQIGEEIGVDGRDNFADIINNEENFEDGTNSSQDSLPSSQDAEDLFNKKNIDTRSAKITETINLLRGYRHLKKVLKHNDTQNEERSSYLGILDVKVCINKCHEILMKDVMTKDKTVPGKFSVLMRYTEFNGEKYYYPHYETEDVAHEAVQAIVDQYNKMLYEISNDKSERNKLENSFKCASVLLFGFLTLHPFSDGNGRLARLLCSHCLNMFSPFPTAIYNVFSPSTRDDYITAIVNARTNLELSSDKLFSDARGEAMLILEQKPADLCSLIIESNWFTWRRFLRNIGEDIPMLDFEMAD